MDELRRYVVRILTHTGRTLPRRVVTFHGPYKAVALACEQIHRQLGLDDPSVLAQRVEVEDLGRVESGAFGGYAIEDGEVFDQRELR